MNENLRDWMNRNEMSNTQVAKRMGIGRELVWRFVTGERPVTERFKWRFVETFGIDAAIEVFGDSIPNTELT